MSDQWSHDLYLEFDTADPEGSCRDMIDLAYFLVSWTGQSYVTPNPEPGCHTEITSPCSSSYV